ncbi:MAG: hypothetical protein GAK31_01052 [Stenotrophomonas maltophilia]|uniref:Fibronectin type-III domain-containing protein n=1 Tax=Stenotrophomonas maltophilia TaxID=40324 RepID=A0A7V8FH03_STEMA|nr:MAG: hypothetical protein GAK31_01052 [Stenotrophomonas maltophilia]
MSSSIDPAAMRRPGTTSVMATWGALLLLLLLCCITAPAAAQSLPGAPVIGTASSNPVPPGQSASATVTFTAPASDGGSPIPGYTLTSSPGGITSSTSSSPASINGLTLGTSYTFSVTATNGVGTGSPSGASNAVTPRGQQVLAFTNPGDLNFGTNTPLQATSSSSLPVLLVSNTLNTCEIIINTHQVRARAPGICSVTASQPGDGAYLPAPDVTQSFQIVVPGGALSIATTSLPSPIRGTPYTQTIVATSGAPPYTFAVVSGALPANLTLNPVTGTISGLVRGVGAYNIRVRVTDAALQTAERSYAGVVIVPVLTISPATLPTGRVGVPLASTTFTTTGGIGAYTYAITAGALPAGLSLSPAGVLAGTPTAAGTANITVTSTDAYNASASQPLTVVISDAPRWPPMTWPARPPMAIPAWTSPATTAA